MSLVVDDVSSGYGRATVVASIGLKLEPGRISAVVGSNGAGKSTLARTICGLLATRSGSITLEDRSVQKLSAAQRARAGIIMVPEGRRLFGGLTVAENVRLGAFAARGRRKASMRQVETLLDAFPVLRERWSQRAGQLSGGEQQMVALTRAVASAPKYLLLDEPSLGLSPKLTQEVFRLIQLIAAETGAGVLLIEQMADDALSLAQDGHVLEQGRITVSGAAGELRSSQDVRAAYLGTIL
ncbi:ABC transporter ATP-binding protein [Nocardioides panzhihuensis]|uniref:Branched-chain amino acid transport system ATP-binding protein n=1 Tax=Nocardioides panzhihuensis TaxID=860243 RepID=A0A7Z0IR96_9ACTN|nr:ABC transporter ATP-binding protein [Nocardioides panzhihuensis]NYI76774.1 branched-chain amino acid transport system ATP-binding protein [Nocardioides panzhihuensis]